MKEQSTHSLGKSGKSSNRKTTPAIPHFVIPVHSPSLPGECRLPSPPPPLPQRYSAGRAGLPRVGGVSPTAAPRAHPVMQLRFCGGGVYRANRACGRLPPDRSIISLIIPDFSNYPRFADVLRGYKEGSMSFPQRALPFCVCYACVRVEWHKVLQI